MRILIGNVYYPQLDAHTVVISRDIADPVPTCNLTLVDNTSALTIHEMDEVIVLDDKRIAQPNVNNLVNPSMNPYAGSGSDWNSLNTTGVTFTQNSGGGVVFTINNPADNSHDYSQTTGIAVITVGEQYTFSATLSGSVTSGGLTGNLAVAYYDGVGTFLQGATSAQITPTGTPQLVTLFTIPPPNAKTLRLAMQFAFTSSPAAGTLVWTQAQLEPNWFPDYTYPTPWCGPGATNAYQMPDTTWIRQYRKFGGFVTHAVKQNYRGPVRDYVVTASGYAFLMGTRTTAAQFANTNDATILKDLNGTAFVDANGNYLFTSNHVQTGATFASLNYAYDDLRSCFDGICGATGFYWTIDPYRDIWYAPPGYYSLTQQLIADGSGVPDQVTTFAAYDFSAELDFTQPGNNILVIGGNPGTTSLTAALVNGTNYSSLAVNAMPNAFDAGQTFTLSDSTNTQTWTLSSGCDQNDTSLSVNAQNANFSYHVGSNLTAGQPVVRVIDPNAVAFYGLTFERKINDSNLFSLGDAVTRGTAELLQFDYGRNLYHLSTQLEMIAGYGVAVTSATDGLARTMLLIQKAQAKWLGTDETLSDVWEYSADLGAVNRDVTNMVAKLARDSNTNEEGVPAVQETRLVVVEPTGLTEGLSAYPLAVGQDAPIAYYRLDDWSGPNAADSSGNGYTGAYAGSGVTYLQSGPLTYDPDQCVLFDGAAGEMTMPSGVNTAGWTALTLECFVKLTSTSFGSAATLFANDQPGSSNTGVALQINASASALNFRIGTGSHNTLLQAPVSFVAGNWYHIAATWDGATMLIYVNGAAQPVNAARAGSISAASNQLAIGYNPAAAGNYLPGYQAQAAIYDSAVSASHVTAHYQAASAQMAI